VMPFESLREISDTDMRALYLFLRQLPPPRKGWTRRSGGPGRARL